MFDSLLSRFISARSALGVSEDRRGPELREAVTLAAELELDGKRVPIEIGNISSGGLMAVVDGKVGDASQLAVWIEGRRLTGEVRWHGDGRFGMRFDTPTEFDSTLIERYRSTNAEQSKQMSRWMI